MAQLNESRAASIPSTKRYKEKNMVLCVARVCNPTVLRQEDPESLSPKRERKVRERKEAQLWIAGGKERRIHPNRSPASPSLPS